MISFVEFLNTMIELIDDDFDYAFGSFFRSCATKFWCWARSFSGDLILGENKGANNECIGDLVKLPIITETEKHHYYTRHEKAMWRQKYPYLSPVPDYSLYKQEGRGHALSSVLYFIDKIKSSDDRGVLFHEYGFGNRHSLYHDSVWRKEIEDWCDDVAKIVDGDLRFLSYDLGFDDFTFKWENWRR